MRIPSANYPALTYVLLTNFGLNTHKGASALASNSASTKKSEETGKKWAIRLRDSFASRVGWRVQGAWLSISSLTYNADAPIGHLPGAGAWVTSLVWGLWARGADYFYNRVDICQL